MPATPADIERTRRFDAIVREYSPLVARVCYLFADKGACFDDLYQESLINLWVGLDTFRGESKPSTWIYRTTINTCITWHRRNDRHSGNLQLIDALTISDPSGDPSTIVETGEEIRRLHTLISHLPPIEKAIITLWLDDRSYDEIADITGLSRTNVAVKLHRIKTRLTAMESKL